MYYFFPWFSKYRGWMVMKHAGGSDQIELDFLQTAETAAGISRQRNLDPVWMK